MGYGKFKFVVWSPDFENTYKILKEMCNKYEFNYLVMGQECCPTTGRQHVNGYYEYPRARKLDTELNKFNKHFGKGFGNLQAARGSHGENFDYSSKDERNVYEFGTPARQGVRKDLIEAQKEINDGKSVDNITIENPMLYHIYGRTLNKLEDLRMRKMYRTTMTKGTWIYGPTGTGKSREAFKNFHPSTHYVVPNDNGWWDGYCQQETVIINDFRGKIPYDELLQIVDKYPYSVKRRGREPMPFVSKHVIITSSLSPQECYHNRLANDSIEQLLRRFHVVEFTESYSCLVGVILDPPSQNTVTWQSQTERHESPKNI